MSTNTSAIIKLNIGGTKFQTTASTLLKYPDCFFGGLLSGRFPATLDEKGAYFIDRDGEYFKPILQYLRSGVLQIPKGMNLDILRQEANFYLIPLPDPEDTLSIQQEDSPRIHHHPVFLIGLSGYKLGGPYKAILLKLKGTKFSVIAKGKTINTESSEWSPEMLQKVQDAAIKLLDQGYDCKEWKGPSLHEIAVASSPWRTTKFTTHMKFCHYFVKT